LQLELLPLVISTNRQTFRKNVQVISSLSWDPSSLKLKSQKRRWVARRMSVLVQEFLRS